MSVTVQHTLVTSIRIGEYDSTLQEIGQAVLDRLQILNNEKSLLLREHETEESPFRVGENAVVESLQAEWKHNGTIIHITKVLRKTANGTVLSHPSGKLRAGQQVAFPLAVLRHIEIKPEDPPKKVVSKRRVKKGNR